MEKYSKLSITLTKKINKEEKKKNGIFFTPPKTIKNIITQLSKYTNNFETIKYILEPACGSCEFINMLNNLFPNKNIVGIENNETIYESIKNIGEKRKNIKIIYSNYLNYENKQNKQNKNEKKYDLIIGNPPFFVMKKKEVNKNFYKYFDGRPNIFILFIIKSLSLLNNNGILAFVLPKSFTNCLYYDKTRKYIAQNFNILNIIDCIDEYIETKQETIVLILKKGENKQNENYVYEKGGYTFFGSEEKIKTITELYEKSTTLNEMGFKVNVGNVVWNQNKDSLTDDETKTRLIYSSDISNNKLNYKKYKNEKKKNFIDKDGKTEPLLVINRGYGVGTYKFNYCLIEGGFDYLVENHLICIRYNGKIEKKKLIKKYNQIITSFTNEKTKKFINEYFGNSAMNCTELNNVLPIYIV